MTIETVNRFRVITGRKTPLTRYHRAIQILQCYVVFYAVLRNQSISIRLIKVVNRNLKLRNPAGITAENIFIWWPPDTIVSLGDRPPDKLDND